jgi:protein TonB
MKAIMKNLHNTEENVTNGIEDRESFKKQDANLKSNSSLYFQIGLIVCLLGTYGLFEMNFQIHLPKIIVDEQITDNPCTIATITVQSDAPEAKPIEKKVVMLTDKPPVIKPNTFVNPNPTVLTTPDAIVPQPGPIVKTPTLKVMPAPAPPTTLNMRDLEKVPIFPGCESAKNNEERMSCMSEKLTKLIQRKFNTGLAAELGLQGLQRIQVQFKIDDTGHVTDIQTRSPHEKLSEEAERVVNKIPVMTPGMQKNIPVSVVYNLPIAFQVQ